MKRLVLAVFAVLAGYACAEAAASPRAPDVAALQEATDSTVVVHAEIFGQADAWRWNVADKSGESTIDSIAVEIARHDTTATYSFCASGVNYNSDRSREAVGPEACSGTFDVPPTPLDEPAVPDSIKVEIDSVLAHNMRLDSLSEAGHLAVQAGPYVYCPASGGGASSRGVCETIEESQGIAYDADMSWRTVNRAVIECLPEPNCLEIASDSTRAGVPCRDVGREGTGPETWECA